MTKWNGILCLSALMAVLFVPVAGCGGDDDTSGSGGKGGSKSGSSGSGTDVAGTGGSSGAAGGNSINDLINMFTMCEADAKNVDSCGNESCPAPASGGFTACTVSCCTSDNHCGTRTANAAFAQFGGSACAAPAKADPRCPNTNLGPMSLPGCCDGSNQCGLLVGTMCASGGLIGGFGGGAPRAQACDAANGGDAGVDSDAGR